MVSETWPPCRTRESRSRPSWSVPNRWPSVSGGSRRAEQVLVLGSGSGSTWASSDGDDDEQGADVPTRSLTWSVATAGGTAAVRRVAPW